MKKITMTLVTIILCLSVNIICYAGDIISPLMLQEDSQVYFGEIKHITDDSLVIMQKKNVKGDFDFGFFLANLIVFGSSSSPQFSITIGHLTKLGHI